MFEQRVKHEIKVETVTPDKEYIINYTLYTNFERNHYPNTALPLYKVYEQSETYRGNYYGLCSRVREMEINFKYPKTEIVLPEFEQRNDIENAKAEKAEVKSMIATVKDKRAEKRAQKKGLINSK